MSAPLSQWKNSDFWNFSQILRCLIDLSWFLKCYRKMLCRNVYSLTVKLSARLKIPCNVREFCSVKKQHIGTLSSFSPCLQTYRQSFITTTTDAKIFYRRFILSTCQNCRKHDDVKRRKGSVQQVHTYCSVIYVMTKRNWIKAYKIYLQYYQFINW